MCMFVQLERDREQLLVDVESLRRQLTESRDRCDNTAAEKRQLQLSLTACQQSATETRDTLRHKASSSTSVSSSSSSVSSSSRQL